MSHCDYDRDYIALHSDYDIFLYINVFLGHLFVCCFHIFKCVSTVISDFFNILLKHA